MNETVQLLQDVVRSARTGLDAVEQLMDRAETPRMRGELSTQREEYREAIRSGERALQEAGGREEAPGALSRAGMWLGLQADTLADRSNAHIAEIVIQGATMGVIEMTKSMNTYEDADSHARGLASDLIVRQNAAIDRVKGFLED